MTVGIASANTRLIRILISFTVAKIPKQPKHLPVGEQIKKMRCMYTMRYYPAFEKGNPAIGDNMDERGGHCTKQSKPGTETNTTWSLLYVESENN